MADDDGAGPSTSYGGGGGGRGGGRGRGRGGGSSSAGGRSSGGDDDGPPSPRRYKGITWNKKARKWKDQTATTENGKDKKICAGAHETQEAAARAHAW